MSQKGTKDVIKKRGAKNFRRFKQIPKDVMIRHFWCYFTIMEAVQVAQADKFLNKSISLVLRTTTLFIHAYIVKNPDVDLSFEEYDSESMSLQTEEDLQRHRQRTQTQFAIISGQTPYEPNKLDLFTQIIEGLKKITNDQKELPTNLLLDLQVLAEMGAVPAWKYIFSRFKNLVPKILQPVRIEEKNFGFFDKPHDKGDEKNTSYPHQRSSQLNPAVPHILFAAIGCVELVELILSQDYDPYSGPSEPGNANALHYAVLGNHKETVRLLTQSKYLPEHPKTINQRDRDGNTPLMLAVPKGDLEITRLLLEAKAEISDEVYVCCFKSNHPNKTVIFDTLCEVRPPNLEYVNSEGETLAVIAIKQGLPLDTIKALVSIGGQEILLTVDRVRQGAFHAAALSQNYSVNDQKAVFAYLLATIRDDFDQKFNGFGSPLELAILEGTSVAREILLREHLNQALLEEKITDQFVLGLRAAAALAEVSSTHKNQDLEVDAKTHNAPKEVAVIDSLPVQNPAQASENNSVVENKLELIALNIFKQVFSRLKDKPELADAVFRKLWSRVLDSDVPALVTLFLQRGPIVFELLPQDFRPKYSRQPGRFLNKNMTALSYAVRNHRIKILPLLVNLIPPNQNQKPWMDIPIDGNTILQATVELQQFDAVKLLVEAKADLSMGSFYLKEALKLNSVTTRITEEAVQIFKFLHPQVTKNNSYKELFLLAAENGAPLEVFQCLLEEKAENFDIVNEKGQNIFHVAAKQGASQSTLELLSRKYDPALLDACDKQGYTPIQYAIDNENLSAVQFFLERDVEVISRADVILNQCLLIIQKPSTTTLEIVSALIMHFNKIALSTPDLDVRQKIMKLFKNAAFSLLKKYNSMYYRLLALFISQNMVLVTDCEEKEEVTFVDKIIEIQKTLSYSKDYFYILKVILPQFHLLSLDKLAELLKLTNENFPVIIVNDKEVFESVFIRLIESGAVEAIILDQDILKNILLKILQYRRANKEDDLSAVGNKLIARLLDIAEKSPNPAQQQAAQKILHAAAFELAEKDARGLKLLLDNNVVSLNTREEKSDKTLFDKIFESNDLTSIYFSREYWYQLPKEVLNARCNEFYGKVLASKKKVRLFKMGLGENHEACQYGIVEAFSKAGCVLDLNSISNPDFINFIRTDLSYNYIQSSIAPLKLLFGADYLKTDSFLGCCLPWFKTYYESDLPSNKELRHEVVLPFLLDAIIFPTKSNLDEIMSYIRICKNQYDIPNRVNNKLTQLKNAEVLAKIIEEKTLPKEIQYLQQNASASDSFSKIQQDLGDAKATANDQANLNCRFVTLWKQIAYSQYRSPENRARQNVLFSLLISHAAKARGISSETQVDVLDIVKMGMTLNKDQPEWSDAFRIFLEEPGFTVRSKRTEGIHAEFKVFVKWLQERPKTEMTLFNQLVRRICPDFQALVPQRAGKKSRGVTSLTKVLTVYVSPLASVSAVSQSTIAALTQALPSVPRLTGGSS